MSDEEEVVTRDLDSDTDSSSDELVVGDEVAEASSTLIQNEEIALNYERLGTPVPPPPSPTSLFELRQHYPQAFSPESEYALEAVLVELQLPFALSAFQTFGTNALLNKVDVIGILPTGSGKTLVMIA